MEMGHCFVMYTLFLRHLSRGGKMEQGLFHQSK